MRDVNISISSVFSTCSAVPSRAKMQRNVQYDEFQRSTTSRAVVSTGSARQAQPTPPRPAQSAGPSRSQCSMEPREAT